MTGFIGLTKRNLLLYFKDLGAIIYSLLTSIIVFALYLIFLKQTFIDSIDENSVGLEAFISDNDVELLVSALLLVGVVGSALITVAFSCLTTVIKDREHKIDYDISATPIKRWQIILSYFCASTISTFIITAIILTVGLVILSSIGDINMTTSDIVITYLYDLLGSLSSTAIFMIIALFFKSTSVSGAFFGLLSAASGFIIGAYIPLSSFSKSVQTICNLFPATHITLLLRSKIMGGVLANIDSNIGGVDNGLFIKNIRDCFGFNAKLFGNTLAYQEMISYISILFAISLVIMIITYNKTYKRH